MTRNPELPTSFRVGTSWVTIRLEGEDWVRSSNVCAQWDSHFCRITLSDNAQPAQQAGRLLHEIAHVIHWEYGLASEETISDERACDAASYRLVQTLIDNPALLQWLTWAIEQGNTHEVSMP